MAGTVMAESTVYGMYAKNDFQNGLVISPLSKMNGMARKRYVTPDMTARYKKYVLRSIRRPPAW